MKLNFKPLHIAALVGVFVSSASADEVSTVPEGYVTVNVAAGTGSVAALTYFSAPLLSIAQGVNNATGRITGVTANTITNSGAAWTSAGLAQTGSPYFVRILTGPAQGYIFQITSNTATVLTVDNQGVALDTKSIATGAPGDQYEIFPGDTLLSLLGAPSVDNPIVGGTGPNDASDKVFIMEGGAWATYYYNTTASQWRRGAVPATQNNKVLHPNTSILYSRIGTTALSYTILGKVPNSKNIAMINANGSSGISAFFPSEQTLNSFNFQSLPGWKKVGDVGITSGNADKVFLYEGGAWSAYHYNATVSQWRRGAVPASQNGKIIPVSSGILITRTGTSGVNELTVNLPYSLE